MQATTWTPNGFDQWFLGEPGAEDSGGTNPIYDKERNCPWNAHSNIVTTSPNITPATKHETATSPNAALAAKGDIPT